MHYEVYGRGRPVILLHGWLGSWGLWHQTMTHLYTDYRLYALDFWGFGESGKRRESYSIEDFVSLVGQFMDQLGIEKAPLIGHSMGGTVSMAFAIQNPQRVTKIGVIGSPVDGNSLSLLLKFLSLQLVATVIHNALWTFKLGVKIGRPLFTKEPRWPEMISADLSKTTMDSFLLSITSLRRTNLRERLGELNVPLMGIYGAKDVIVNPNQKDLVLDLARRPNVVFYTDAGHFPMLDVPERFMGVLKEFLDSSD